MWHEEADGAGLASQGSLIQISPFLSGIEKINVCINLSQENGRFSLLPWTSSKKRIRFRSHSLRSTLNCRRYKSEDYLAWIQRIKRLTIRRTVICFEITDNRKEMIYPKTRVDKFRLSQNFYIFLYLRSIHMWWEIKFVIKNFEIQNFFRHLFLNKLPFSYCDWFQGMPQYIFWHKTWRRT